MSTGKDVVICDTCQLDTGVKTVQCEKCLRNFHTKCTKFQPFTTTKGTNSRTCQFCINDMLSSSTGVKTRTGSTCSTGAPTRSAGPLPGDSVLQTILAKLEALGKVTQATSLKVDAIDKRSENFEKVRFTAMEDRMSSMEAKLDQLPALALRISDIEARIEGVEAEQRAVRATLDSIDAGGSLGEIPPIVTRVGSMETAIRGLADGVAKINAERARLSSELLISGLTQPEL